MGGLLKKRCYQFTNALLSFGYVCAVILTLGGLYFYNKKSKESTKVIEEKAYVHVSFFSSIFFFFAKKISFWALKCLCEKRIGLVTLQRKKNTHKKNK